QRSCAGPGLVVAFGGLTSDRATDGPDSATDDGTRRATDRGSDGCPGQGAPAGTERLGAMLVGVFPGVVDGPAPIHRPVHRAVHLVPIESRIERVDVAVDAPRVVAIHELASSSLGVGWGSHGPYVRPGPGRRQLRDGRRNRRISAFRPATGMVSSVTTKPVTGPGR